MPSATRADPESRTGQRYVAKPATAGQAHLGHVGLLTVDVTALGIVMTSDSRPIEIGSGDIRVPPFVGEQRRNKILERHGGGFDGLIGYAGTEQIGGRSTRAFIEQVSTACPDLGLGDSSISWRTSYRGHGSSANSRRASGSLSRERKVVSSASGSCATSTSTAACTSIFGAPSPPWTTSTSMPSRGSCEKTTLTSKDEVLSRIALFFRNGALIPAASILDDFDALIRRLYAGGYAGFDPISSLDEYARLVRMRQEFVKRMFDSSKGIYRAGRSPIGGVIYIRSVSPQGAIFEHGKNVKS